MGPNVGFDALHTMDSIYKHIYPVRKGAMVGRRISLKGSIPKCVSIWKRSIAANAVPSYGKDHRFKSDRFYQVSKIDGGIESLVC